jgi:hypothetical protein
VARSDIYDTPNAGDNSMLASSHRVNALTKKKYLILSGHDPDKAAGRE